MLPALRDYYDEQYQYPNLTLKAVSTVYNSANFPPMAKADLRKLLLRPGVLPEEIAREFQKGGGA